MLNLFFRKNFYDGWDNIIFLFIPNLILDAMVVVSGLLCIPGFTIFKESSWYLYIWIVIGILLMIGLSIFTLAWAETSTEIVDYGSPDIKSFFASLKTCVKDGILYGIVMSLFCVASFIGIVYFFKPAEGQPVTFTGLTAGAVWTWVSITILMGLLWYPAVRASMHNKFGKALKKCFILLFDNLGRCIIFSFYNLLLVLISVVMLGLVPGMAGLQMARTNFIKLIMKKYDYLEELDKKGEPLNSKARRKIPWKELLAEENEINPVRTAKEFFFPWKQDSNK